LKLIFYVLVFTKLPNSTQVGKCGGLRIRYDNLVYPTTIVKSVLF